MRRTTDPHRSLASVRRADRPATKIARVDESLWTAIQAVTAEDLRALLGPLLGDRAVSAMIERRKVMKKTIDELVARKGRASSSFPATASGARSGRPVNSIARSRV